MTHPPSLTTPHNPFKSPATFPIPTSERLEVLLAPRRGRLHRNIPGLPPRRAHLVGVLLSELNRLQRPQRLVNAPAERQVVDRRVLHDALLIDDEEPAQRHAVRAQHPVRLRHLPLQVREQRVVELPKPALVARGLEPREVRELGVHRAAEDLRVDRRELRVPVRERGDLRRAHEGEVQRVEKQHHILPLIVAQLRRREVLVKHRRHRKLRRLAPHQRPVLLVAMRRRRHHRRPRRHRRAARGGDREGAGEGGRGEPGGADGRAGEGGGEE
eukprot:CAMPEP_0174895384 /NCGR_PEP_ID=MMETSP0167-20121228/9811_1 /TAXON_ID=38298 /ORGANISM="Rhodella maculata, Strain CCMP736" /LENGTH=270 /DNA_ID=CAMNT_0016134701 /DNA_START=78 /DNA_END=887 /DNA_ORIENTATION=+